MGYVDPNSPAAEAIVGGWRYLVIRDDGGGGFYRPASPWQDLLGVFDTRSEANAFAVERRAENLRGRIFVQRWSRKDI